MGRGDGLGRGHGLGGSGRGLGGCGLGGEGGLGFGGLGFNEGGSGGGEAANPIGAHVYTMYEHVCTQYATQQEYAVTKTCKHTF